MTRIREAVLGRIIGAGVDDRGVALPLALVGVVFVSILVTGMLVTSSLESAMSRAHQDGLRSIYESEGAIEAFVEENFLEIWEGALASGSYSAGQGTNSTTRDITFARLRDQEGDVGQRDVTTSIVAEPANGRGRSVGVLLTHLVPPRLETEIDEGAIFGSDAAVSGRARISDGSDGDGEYCALGPAGSAIRYGSDVELTIGGASEITGKVEQADKTGAELVAGALGGKIENIRSLAQFAQVKFGELYGERRTYTRSGSDPDPRISSVDFPRNSPFNWGCPKAMDDQQDCGNKSNSTDYFPSVAIDAEGGTVKIQGWHGQGTLMVVNGNLEIDGNFNYRGIVMVEGDIRIAGSGQNIAKIEGAVIASGDVAVDDGSGSEIEGGAVIRYNACAIEDAERGFYSAGHNAIRRTGWFEVVR
jgi:hypothetical protein